VSNAPVDPGRFAQWQAESRRLDEGRIAFLVGPPKCGTTWVMRCLDGHPHAVARGESNVGRALVPNLVAAFQQYNAHQANFGNGDVARFGDEDFLFLLRQIVDRQLLRYRQSAPAPDEVRAVIDKSPAHSQHVALLARLYPEARFVCCTRDVRDGAVSAWHHFGPQGWIKEPTLEAYARTYAERTWAVMLRDARAAAATLGPGRWMEIEFADHKADPGGTMRGLLEFLGLDADEESVAASVAAGSFERATGGRSAGTEERGSFFRKGAVGDWRNHLSEADGQAIAELADAVLAGAAVAAPA
jgi:hypothetical protein